MLHSFAKPALLEDDGVDEDVLADDAGAAAVAGAAAAPFSLAGALAVSTEEVTEDGSDFAPPFPA